MIRLPVPDDFAYPDMVRIHQQPDVPAAVDVTHTLAAEWKKYRQRLTLQPGARIAVGIGSRDSPDLVSIVKTVVTWLKQAGAEPFITSAMGSHGGATVKGQTEILAKKGITASQTGVPVRVTMDVVPIGEADGIPLYMDRLAHEAEGIVLINRVKPHTDFTGPMESGVIKMLCIGLGNQKGADLYHRAAVGRGFSNMLLTVGRHLLQTTRFLFGVAVVENQNKAICDIRLGTAQDMAHIETRLLKKAYYCLPGLPIDTIDLLIVDEMGKDISGAGMDPNVVGGKGICIWSDDRPLPDITRIFVRDLTAASNGNAMGLGMVHVVTPKLADKIDMQATATNAVTACCPEDCKIPLTLATEKEAVAAALLTVRPYTMEDLRVVHIKNTRDITRMLVSRGCLPDLEKQPGISIISDASTMTFDKTGQLSAYV